MAYQSMTEQEIRAAFAGAFDDAHVLFVQGLVRVWLSDGDGYWFPAIATESGRTLWKSPVRVSTGDLAAVYLNSAP